MPDSRHNNYHHRQHQQISCIHSDNQWKKSNFYINYWLKVALTDILQLLEGT